MRTKQILFALAAPLFIAACSNEDFVDNAASNIAGEQVSTKDIRFIAESGDVQTRMGFNGNALTWQMSNTTGGLTDQLGFCQILNGQAQTNYQFFVNSIISKAGNEYTVNGAAFEPSTVGEADKKNVTIVGSTMYGPSASFSTPNATIFSGKYLAYYPYSTEFNEASATIPVKVAEVQTANANETNYLGQYGFYVSDQFTVEKGGQQEAKFAMKQVLPILEFQLASINGSFEVSQIQISAEGGMPLAAGMDATLTTVTADKLTVDSKSNVDAQYLTITNASLTAQTAEEAKMAPQKKVYMTVMPGTYTNMKVKVILTDGNYWEKTIPSLTLGLNSLQPIALYDMNSDGMNEGARDMAVVDGTQLNAALARAAKYSSGTTNIRVLSPITVSEITIGATIGAKTVISGEKITVTNAFTPGAAASNLVFENEVEFHNTVTTTTAGFNATFAGTTTFKGTVIVSDGTILNIGGNATAKATVTVGNAIAAVATLNILKGATLNAEGAVAIATQATAHAINVNGALNLKAGSSLAAGNGSNVITMEDGTITADAKTDASAAAIINLTEGKWNVNKGTIVNNGTLNLNPAKIDALKAGETALALTNNGEMNVAFANIANIGDKVDITNNGTYTFTGLTTVADMEAVLDAKGTGDYAGVNGLEIVSAATATLNLTTEKVDYSSYTLTFAVNPAGSPAIATVQIPAGETLKAKDIFVELKGSTNKATLKFQSVGTSSGQDVTVSAEKLVVKGVGTVINNELEFAANSSAKSFGKFNSITIDNAVVKRNGNEFSNVTTLNGGSLQ